jgi:TonB family protein
MKKMKKMKKILILSIFLCVSVVFSQKKEEKSNVIKEIKNKTVEEVKTPVTVKKLGGETEEEVDVPFQVIENPPVFPGCENTIDKRECFQRNIQQHIVRNFRYPDAALEAAIQGKVFVSFVVEKDGTINVVSLRSPSPILDQEAKRIMELLPILKPGIQRGKPVRMTMSIPITFKLLDDVKPVKKN